MKTRVMYLRNSKGAPLGCVTILVDRHARKIKYQLSTCNPQDRFDAKQGQLMSLNRLVESPVVIPLPRKNVNMNTITEAVMKSISMSKVFPGRAVKSANMWLKKAELKRKAVITFTPEV